MRRRKQSGGTWALLALVACAMLLHACGGPGSGSRAGAALLDEVITLTREESRDFARREFDVKTPSTIVVFADELETDVALRIEVSAPAVEAAGPIEVESRFTGTGLEVGALTVPSGARVLVSLDGPQDSIRPGKVRLRVTRFDSSALPATAQAYLEWTKATRTSARAEDAGQLGIPSLDRAIALLESPAGDPSLAAWARFTRANLIYFFELDWHEAWKESQRAERAFLALETPQALPAARARHLAAASLIEMSLDDSTRGPTELAAREQAIAILEELGGPTSPLGPLERARALNNLGYLSHNVGANAAAQAYMERALAAYRAIGYRAGAAQVLANLATGATQHGDFRTAARMYDEMLPDLLRDRDPDHRALWLRNAGDAHRQAGNTDKAIHLLLRALEESRKYRMPVNEGRALESLGASYWHRGDVLQAELYFSQASRIFASTHDNIGMAVALRYLGTIARGAGDQQGALDLHRKSAARSTSPVGRIRALSEVALDYAGLSNYRRAIATCREALRIPTDNGADASLGSVKLVLAQLLVEQPNAHRAAVAEAMALANEVLEQSAARSDLAQEIGARRLLGQGHVIEENYAAASAQYERAIELIFEDRGMSTNPELQSTTLANERATFQAYVDLLMRGVSRRAVGEFAAAGLDEEAALRLLEFARARNFDASRLDSADPTAGARADVLLTQMAGKRVRIETLLERDPKSAAKIGALQLEIADLRAELDGLRVRVESPAVRAIRRNDVRPWPQLPPGTTQLSYAAGSRHVYLWVRDSQGIRAARLPPGPQQLDAALRALATIDRLQSPARYEQELVRVARLLLPSDAVDDRASTLEIVAEGRIAGVPFAALPRAEALGRRLVESHGIRMIASMLDERPRAPRPHALRLVAVAGGAGPLPESFTRGHLGRLRSVLPEAQAIATMFRASGGDPRVKLLTGADGSAAAIRRFWEEGADVVHFATHGLADLKQPLASLLVLPAKDAAGNLTYLTAGQVQEWRGAAGLVYLSACESAVGPARFADGMPGLQRAFLRAGADSVIATLWPIEDVLAKEFSTEFYRRLTAGGAPTEALRDTQRAWLASKAGGTSDALHRHMTAWAHVYYAR